VNVSIVSTVRASTDRVEHPTLPWKAPSSGGGRGKAIGRGRGGPPQATSVTKSLSLPTSPRPAQPVGVGRGTSEANFLNVDPQGPPPSLHLPARHVCHNLVHAVGRSSCGTEEPFHPVNAPPHLKSSSADVGGGLGTALRRNAAFAKSDFVVNCPVLVNVLNLVFEGT
jgi:hypothetical protein